MLLFYQQKISFYCQLTMKTATGSLSDLDDNLDSFTPISRDGLTIRHQLEEVKALEAELATKEDTMAHMETQCRKLTHAGYIQEPQLYKVWGGMTTGHFMRHRLYTETPAIQCMKWCLRTLRWIQVFGIDSYPGCICTTAWITFTVVMVVLSRDDSTQ